MPLVYNIPSICKKHQGAQRGPTCWYYASKMLLKFHVMKPAKDSGESWISWLALKYLKDGQMLKGSTFGGKASRAHLDDLQGMIDSYGKSAVFGEDEFSPAKEAAFSKARAFLDDPRKKERMKGERPLHMMQTYFPAPMFTELEPAHYPGTAADVEALLLRYGPIYAGGPWSNKEGLDLWGPEPPPEAQLANATLVEHKAAPLHAVVLAGVNGDRVFYKDPNYSRHLLQVKFAEWRHWTLEMPWARKNYYYANCNKRANPQAPCQCSIEQRIPLL